MVSQYYVDVGKNIFKVVTFGKTFPRRIKQETETCQVYATTHVYYTYMYMCHCMWIFVDKTGGLERCLMVAKKDRNIDSAWETIAFRIH